MSDDTQYQEPDRDELTRLLVDGSWLERRKARAQLRRLRRQERADRRSAMWEKLLPPARKRGIAVLWFVGLAVLCVLGLISSWVHA